MSSTPSASAARSAATATLPANFTTPPTPNLKTGINNALLASNAIPKIQAALLHECQAAGFVASLRARTLELLRSGECNSYGEVMEKVMGEVKIGGATGVNGKGKEKEVEGVNGEGAAGGSGGRRLRVPSRVVDEGVKVVREAVEGCVEVTGTGDGG